MKLKGVPQTYVLKKQIFTAQLCLVVCAVWLCCDTETKAREGAEEGGREVGDSNMAGESCDARVKR